jgi:hypothetical protein
MASSGDEVILHIYDLSMGMARMMSASILGTQIELIPHTGVVLRGREYFYGGGIQVLPPHQVVEHFGLAPVERKVLGRTTKTDDELRAFLRTIAHKFTMETYDLFHNNCNHFSDECTRFLIGTSIPESISSVPGRVLATPMGAQIGAMMSGMQQRMGRTMGSNDPFTALATGRGAGPIAPGAETVGAPAASSAASPPVSASAPSPPGRVSGPSTAPTSAHIADATKLLAASTRPFVSSETGDLPAVVARLHKANALLPEASPHRLTAADVALVDALPSHLAAEDTTASSAPVCTPDGVCSLPPRRTPGDAWQQPTSTLLARLLREWPRAHSAVPVLSLLRLLALREDCIGALTAGSGAALWDVLETVSEAGGGAGYGSAPANLMALVALLNAFKTRSGASWACSASVRGPLIDTSLRLLRDPKAEVRRVAASVLYNVAVALPVGSDTAEPSISNAPGNATVQVTDTSVQILCGTLEDIAAEADEAAASRRLLAAGVLMRREGREAGELMATLGYGDAAASLAGQSARPAELRALASVVRQSIAQAPAAF